MVSAGYVDELKGLLCASGGGFGDLSLVVRSRSANSEQIQVVMLQL